MANAAAPGAGKNGTLAGNTALENVHFLHCFYKDSADAACIMRNVVLLRVLHGFENARHKWLISREKYHALSDMVHRGSSGKKHEVLDHI